MQLICTNLTHTPQDSISSLTNDFNDLIQFFGDISIFLQKIWNEKWAEEVRIRALDCHDFVAAEARYRLPCHGDFTTGKRLSTATPGRSVASESLNNFNRVCEWLESEAELYSVVEVHTKMTEIADGEDVYGTKWLKAKLPQKYGDSIYFAEISDRSDVVC